MAILAKCAKCKRPGGYAYTSEDTLCGRCRNKVGKDSAKEQDKENK